MESPEALDDGDGCWSLGALWEVPGGLPSPLRLSARSLPGITSPSGSCDSKGWAHFLAEESSLQSLSPRSPFADPGPFHKIEVGHVSTSEGVANAAAAIAEFHDCICWKPCRLPVIECPVWWGISSAEGVSCYEAGAKLPGVSHSWKGSVVLLMAKAKDVAERLVSAEMVHLLTTTNQTLSQAAQISVSTHQDGSAQLIRVQHTSASGQAGASLDQRERGWRHADGCSSTECSTDSFRYGKDMVYQTAVTQGASEGWHVALWTVANPDISPMPSTSSPLTRRHVVSCRLTQQGNNVHMEALHLCGDSCPATSAAGSQHLSPQQDGPVTRLGQLLCPIVRRLHNHPAVEGRNPAWAHVLRSPCGRSQRQRAAVTLDYLEALLSPQKLPATSFDTRWLHGTVQAEAWVSQTAPGPKADSVAGTAPSFQQVNLRVVLPNVQARTLAGALRDPEMLRLLCPGGPDMVDCRNAWQLISGDVKGSAYQHYVVLKDAATGHNVAQVASRVEFEQPRRGTYIITETTCSDCVPYLTAQADLLSLGIERMIMVRDTVGEGAELVVASALQWIHREVPSSAGSSRSAVREGLDAILQREAAHTSYRLTKGSPCLAETWLAQLSSSRAKAVYARHATLMDPTFGIVSCLLRCEIFPHVGHDSASDTDDKDASGADLRPWDGNAVRQKDRKQQ